MNIFMIELAQGYLDNGGPTVHFYVYIHVYYRNTLFMCVGLVVCMLSGPLVSKSFHLHLTRYTQ